jgi:hypothetical protein
LRGAFFALPELLGAGEPDDAPTRRGFFLLSSFLNAATYLAWKAMRFFVVVKDDEIIVTSETGFRATYGKRPNLPQLKVRRVF